MHVHAHLGPCDAGVRNARLEGGADDAELTEHALQLAAPPAQPPAQQEAIACPRPGHVGDAVALRLLGRSARRRQAGVDRAVDRSAASVAET